jgi:hypothetical protein
MNEAGVFKGIPDMYLEQVKRDFENKINIIKPNIQPKDTLITLNKRVLTEMMIDMAKYKGVPSAPMQTQVPSIVTAKDISAQRQDQFRSVFEKKKEEFNLFSNKPPSSIDFSDKLDKPIGSEIEDMLAATIARRNNDLNIVLDKQDTLTATKWINSDNGASANSNASASANNIANNIINSATSSMNNTNNANHFIKIGKSTNLDNNSIIDISKPKQVRFTDSKPTIIENNNISLSLSENPSDENYKMTPLKLTDENDNENDEDVSAFLSVLNNKQPLINADSDSDANANANVDDINAMNYMYDKIKSLFEERMNRFESIMIRFEEKIDRIEKNIELLQIHKNNNSYNDSNIDNDNATDNTRDNYINQISMHINKIVNEREELEESS